MTCDDAVNFSYEKMPFQETRMKPPACPQSQFAFGHTHSRTHALTYTHLSWWVPQRLSRPAHCMWRELSLEVTAVPWVTLSTTFISIHLIKCVRARTCRQRLQIKIHMRLCWTLIAVISHWSQTHRKISADAQGGKWKVSTRTGCCFIIGYRMCWICFFCCFVFKALQNWVKSHESNLGDKSILNAVFDFWVLWRLEGFKTLSIKQNKIVIIYIYIYI